MIKISLLVGLLLLPAFAWAEGPVWRECTDILWDALIAPNLKEYRVYISPTRGGHNLSTPKGPPIPAGSTNTTCAVQGITGVGQKYLMVTAVDAGGNLIGKSAEFPFVLDAVVPGVVNNLRVQGR